MRLDRHGPPVPATTPCGRTRREFLWEAGGGFTGLALTALLSQDGFFNSTAQAAESVPQSDNPLAPRKPHHPAKAKSVICLFMYGGVSQVDTWDPKPELSKHSGKPMPNLDRDPLFKVRKPGTLLGSSRKFTNHGQSGIEVSDFYPHLARRVDDLAVIRGTYADSFAHGSGLIQMNTGYLRQGYPCLGSWVSYGLGTVNQNLPAFVVLLDQRGGPISGPPNWGAGFMPAAHQGTQLRVSGDPILYLSPPAGVSTSQQRNQLDLLAEFNRQHQQRHAGQQRVGRAHRQLRTGLSHAGQRPRGGRSRSGNRDDETTLRPGSAADREVRPALSAGPTAG